ncbi:Dynein regulatory complex subunit 4 [Caenorhabditis elegans]|uniref:Dynein regulatory complex subunit 4 n=1 Tax=Caenorhabditis elegans TaxID=6239 RepID=Q9XW20_CAEEL|nr:Dynein regulatory complex subunit 4 [Caenorhabditis elegans]CAA22314.1 Dynein regulatory complex subunit 4 [Caenorhabditis elegans]|eukprot:NP_493249.1 Uncharacterized protein CELE_Y18D10A.11 [Caenorhabditis elegans]
MESSSRIEIATLKDELLDELKRRVAEKTAQNVKLQQDAEEISKKLDAALSPRKDRITQLESRLEVVQQAAKAQQKRWEGELASSRAQNEQLSEEKSQLQKENEELLLVLLRTEGIVDANKSLSEQLANAQDAEVSMTTLKETVAKLEEENNVLQATWAEERSGLVNELIDTKEKLAKSAQAQTELDESHRDIMTAVPVAKRTAMDEMFPELDPAIRQLVHLIGQNENYMYAAAGLALYALLIHLYILL